VEVARDLHRIPDVHRDAGLLQRFARRGLADVLTPLDEAAGEAPAPGPELPRPPLHEEHAAPLVADHARRAHAGLAKKRNPQPAQAGRS
jgi:hypothetical protein